MDDLITRIRRMGWLILIGIFLIIYAALGFVYWQEGETQRDIEKKINQISVVVSKPLPGAEELTAKYDKVNRSLTPLAVPATLELIVGIARESGIDVNPGSGKFNIPAIRPGGSYGTEKVGGGNYQVLSLKSIKVQGDYESVMAFVSDLDSGKTLETMVLKRADISWTEIRYEGEEAARRTEFRNVSSAVSAMMAADNVTAIPNPINYAGGTATNYMGDDPDTAETIEGFPDITTTAAAKDYTGTDTPKNGYVLYQHDKISTDNTTQYETVNYIDTLTTNYYYTCEADGTVRQFDGPDVATATEYLGSAPSKIETIAILAVDIYTKP